MNLIKPSEVRTPALEHDKTMSQRYDVKVGPRGRGERRVMWALLMHLEANGFEARAVFDGDDLTRVKDSKSVMELVFNLDEASVRVARKGAPKDDGTHGILIVLGNSPEEIVADWNYFADDRDGFNAVMDAFDSEQYA